MRAIPRLSKDQERIVRAKVADEIDVQMRAYLIHYDAMWLYALARAYGWRKKRLEQVYRIFYALRERDKARAGGDGYGNHIESEAMDWLARWGVDMEKLSQEGEPVVRTEVRG